MYAILWLIWWACNYSYFVENFQLEKNIKHNLISF